MAARVWTGLKESLGPFPKPDPIAELWFETPIELTRIVVMACSWLRSWTSPAGHCDPGSRPVSWLNPVGDWRMPTTSKPISSVTVSGVGMVAFLYWVGLERKSIRIANFRSRRQRHEYPTTSSPEHARRTQHGSRPASTLACALLLAAAAVNFPKN